MPADEAQAAAFHSAAVGSVTSASGMSHRSYNPSETCGGRKAQMHCLCTTQQAPARSPLQWTSLVARSLLELLLTPPLHPPPFHHHQYTAEPPFTHMLSGQTWSLGLINK